MNLSCRNIATFYLLLMCVQYHLVEGGGVSSIKVTFMCLSPLILCYAAQRITPAMIWGGGYLLWCWFTAYVHIDSPRIATLCYMVMFWVTYMMFYSLIERDAFDKDYFLKLMQGLLWAYIIVLAIQQFFSLMGVQTLEWINLGPHQNILKCQSLSIEPSHSARIMGCAFYAFLKVKEFKNGEPVSIGQLWRENRYLLLGFLYAMIFMQSGTAIFFLMLLGLYFMRLKYSGMLVVLVTSAYFLQQYFQCDQINRVINLIGSIFSGDIEEVVAADGSGSYRVFPVLNIFRLDYNDLHTWIGSGVDTMRNIYFESNFNPRVLVGGNILDFGIISYLIAMVFVFTCCIRPFWSLPTLFFFAGVGGFFGNGAYGWGILMIFTCLTYFYRMTLTQGEKIDAK